MIFKYSKKKRQFIDKIRIKQKKSAGAAPINGRAQYAAKQVILLCEKSE